MTVKRIVQGPNSNETVYEMPFNEAELRQQAIEMKLPPPEARQSEQITPPPTGTYS